jgi:hypothetical protein
MGDPMSSKSHEHFKRTLERKPDLSQKQEAPRRVSRPGEKEFDPLQHGTHQESEHNKHNHPERGAPKH